MQTERDNYLKSNGRVELRHHEHTDFALYEEWYADEEIWNLSSWRPGPMKPAETRRLFESRDNSNADVSFAICLRGKSKSTRTVIGVIGLMNLNEVTASADLSIIIGSPEHRGLGYGPEAMELMLAHGFEEVGLRKICLSVFDFNGIAIRTYQKLGFVYDGRIPKAVTRNDGPHDAILMMITADEWRERYS
ncbi:MAG: GNAT family N-acetyltransferase [Rubrobacter sp.]